MSRRKSATPKERVLAAHPCASIYRHTQTRFYRVLGVNFLGLSAWFRAPNSAWADAAKRLRGKR